VSSRFAQLVIQTLEKIHAEKVKPETGGSRHEFTMRTAFRPADRLAAAKVRFYTNAWFRMDVPARHGPPPDSRASREQCARAAADRALCFRRAQAGDPKLCFRIHGGFATLLQRDTSKHR
jgi:hypothetical protein